MKVNKIIIVEPSPIISAGLIKFIGEISQMNIVSVLDNIDDVPGKMLVYNPDVVIINTITLGFTNNSFIKQLTQNYPDTIFVALITSYNSKNVMRFFRDSIELSDNKHKVVSKLMNLINNRDENCNQVDNVELSNREIDVLVCIAKGLTNKDISDKLSISIHTVITHRKNIIKKTGIKSVSGLTVYALLNNMIEESEVYE